MTDALTDAALTDAAQTDAAQMLEPASPARGLTGSTAIQVASTAITASARRSPSRREPQMSWPKPTTC